MVTPLRWIIGLFLSRGLATGHLVMSRPTFHRPLCGDVIRSRIRLWSSPDFQLRSTTPDGNVLLRTLNRTQMLHQDVKTDSQIMEYAEPKVE
jgi:hypothetical protein